MESVPDGDSSLTHASSQHIFFLMCLPQSAPDLHYEMWHIKQIFPLFSFLPSSCCSSICLKAPTISSGLRPTLLCRSSSLNSHSLYTMYCCFPCYNCKIACYSIRHLSLASITTNRSCSEDSRKKMSCFIQSNLKLRYSIFLYTTQGRKTLDSSGEKMSMNTDLRFSL